MKSVTNLAHRIILGLGYLSILATFLTLILPSDAAIAEIIRMIFGSYFVLFFPGYLLITLFFLPGELDVLERIALSFALSLAVVPLTVFYANLAGMPVNALNVFSLVTFLIILLSIALLLPQRTRV